MVNDTGYFLHTASKYRIELKLLINFLLQLPTPSTLASSPPLVSPRLTPKDVNNSNGSDLSSDSIGGMGKYYFVIDLYQCKVLT